MADPTDGWDARRLPASAADEEIDKKMAALLVRIATAYGIPAKYIAPATAASSSQAKNDEAIYIARMQKSFSILAKKRMAARQGSARKRKK